MSHARAGYLVPLPDVSIEEIVEDSVTAIRGRQSRGHSTKCQKDFNLHDHLLSVRNDVKMMIVDRTHCCGCWGIVDGTLGLL